MDYSAACYRQKISLLFRGDGGGGRRNREPMECLRSRGGACNNDDASFA